MKAMTTSGDGTVGDVRGKSVEELMEILERQEKLLYNKKFIAKLPDRGKKILDYTEKVRAALAEHEKLRKTTGLLSKFKLEFEEKQNEVREKNQIIIPVDQKTILSCPLQLKGSANVSETKNKHHKDAEPTSSEAECKVMKNTEDPLLSIKKSNKLSKETSSSSLSKDLLPKGNKSNAGPTVSLPLTVYTDGMSHKTIDAGIPLVQKEKSQTTVKHDAGAADDLVDRLKMINITSDCSETSSQLKKQPNTLTNQSHFLEVIEKRARSPVHRKEKFRTNRLPSDSDSSTPNQSPGDGSLRLSTEERRAQDRKHLDDITAAKLPPLHHSPAQLLCLEESLTLQIEQKKSYEEKQAKLAAKKLFEKLDIKMGPFNPEGDSYMKYRNQRDDESYDAEE